ncbi:ATP-dependent nuclease [Flavobacterium psychrophilum]|uniref:ATP-dependent nuclease n=1 Tax=Flavobacterium psychrophilum TaxID=96345 RepID=UPI001C8F9B09|nr:AAA family ATPase [Flavobacterium psychrophilum]EKT4497760.1 AAA family ATPase [Flavobacterium psychrophilum]QZK98026.1 AAA family ATPase [Flavobacterium psychrophilum]
MSYIRINTITIKNYRSFGEGQDFSFPSADYLKPTVIVGYNNSGKTNLMSALLYGIGEKFISEKTFEKVDLHNLDSNNQIEIISNLEGSDYGFDYKGNPKSISGEYTITSQLDDNEIISKINKSFFGANKHYGIFYINFHNIKEEIVTQKTSWGNIRSFLGRHIQKLVDSDASMQRKKDVFENEVSESTDKVLNESALSEFIQIIRKNYSTNLRNNDCKVDFGLPNYEDIFLKMMFKIGLNGDTDNLIPIDHFGDGFISMFVMAVIQSIAESNSDDKCLFLFEEPESFLHENHQEYFYKTVLCGLSEKGHQVIYTTHSDRMINPFDTKGLIRLEMDDNNQTICKYNQIGDFNVEQINEDTGEIINLSKYNEFIKTVEPNLNRILFSKKVILVEGPNDVLVYKYAIKQKIIEFISTNDTIINKEKYADAYLNFENISIVCHHGKTTAIYLIKLCKHFDVEHFVINDWDFETDELAISDVSIYGTFEMLKQSDLYKNSANKAMITNNWNLIDITNESNIHFNVKKLESVIGYASANKSSIGIWDLLQSKVATDFNEDLIPSTLLKFLELIEKNEIIENIGV